MNQPPGRDGDGDFRVFQITLQDSLEEVIFEFAGWILDNLPSCLGDLRDADGLRIWGIEPEIGLASDEGFDDVWLKWGIARGGRKQLVVIVAPDRNQVIVSIGIALF